VYNVDLSSSVNNSVSKRLIQSASLDRLILLREGWFFLYNDIVANLPVFLGMFRTLLYVSLSFLDGKGSYSRTSDAIIPECMIQLFH
jgi:hypothetical protein